MSLMDMSVQIEETMRRGGRIADVEDVINHSHFSEEEKAALWLLAWSYLGWRAQRREAHEHLARLTGGPPEPAKRRFVLAG